ncbi:short-chain dehydrogenase reductase [Lipomyces tetrasporus]|uniref:Short-chain dehydrogenase reductase n=1 Tax=Lipomyces tetrasporus TaxID=54092 RepID=A0AAD7QQE0_9ASCO|nr:short-chain dehydrogenase reductase [Lipomyces tetrasporus]KAJ8099568.1 short-chain dehydrogenase reductase [Lipomyces tetrasporus]
MQVVVVFLLFFNPCRVFADQIIIVTGSNVIRHFARCDAKKVILAGRNVAAAEKAKQSIEKSTGRTDVGEVWELDLAFYASVKAFAECVSKLPRIDVFLENAGIAKVNFSLADGHERTITVNVISISMLGLLLLPKLKSPNTFEALDDEKNANMKTRYLTSKLLEVLYPGFVTRNWRLTPLFYEIGDCTTSEVGGRTPVAAATVDNGALRAFKAQNMWTELKEILEKILSGITRSL